MNNVVRFLLGSVLLFTFSSLPAESDETPRTGFFKVEFSPLKLLGERGAADVADIFDSDDSLSWQVYVPESYDSARPAGVMVYVSPSPRGGPPRGWNQTLEDANLIWIGANNSGNRVAVAKRMVLAMLAPRVLVRDYVFDPNRIYLAGFSGGGKTAGLISSAIPEVFRGSIYIGGAEAWKSGTPPPRLDSIKQNRHVFITGTNDFNERLTRRVYAAYKAAGVENCELIVVWRLGHELPGRSVFNRAIEYIDSRNSKISDPT